MTLLFLLMACQDLDVLLERLRSADAEVRNQAETDLLARGTGALPALLKLETDPDPEVRGRVKRAIEEIRRRDRVRAVRPLPVRLTLRLNDEPLAGSLRKVFEPFGLKVDALSAGIERLKERRVSLDLRDAPIWTAVRAVESAADVEIDFGSWGVDVQKGPRRFPVLDFGDVRLEPRIDPPRNETFEVRLVATLPPGSLPMSWEVDAPRIFDDQGREIPIRPDPIPGPRQGPGLRKKAAEPTRGEAWRGFVKADAKTIRFQGKFVAVYPRDLLRHEVDLQCEGGAATKVIHGVKCTFSAERAQNSDAFSIRDSYEPQAEGPARRCLVWAEDARGRWIADLSLILLGGAVGGRSGGGGGPHGDGTLKLAKVVLGEFVGEDPATIAFDFKEIALPSAK